MIVFHGTDAQFESFNAEFFGGRDNTALAWFRERRARLLAQGYQSIDVVEMDGSTAMGVILDPSCITSVTEISHPAARL